MKKVKALGTLKVFFLCFSTLKKKVLNLIIQFAWIIGVQDDFLIMDGRLSLLSNVASRSVLTICYTDHILYNSYKPNSHQYHDVCSLPGLLEAKSMLKSIKQEGKCTSSTYITLNTFWVVNFITFFQRWCPLVTLTLPQRGQTAFCPSPEQSVMRIPSGTEKTQISNLTTATTAASDTLRG